MKQAFIFCPLLLFSVLSAQIPRGGGGGGGLQIVGNCSNTGTPATCGAASAGAFVLPAAATTQTVNTTAVTANSQILISFDSSLGTKLAVTCNTAAPSTPGVSARIAGVSFAITATAPITNPACYSYLIVN